MTATIKDWTDNVTYLVIFKVKIWEQRFQLPGLELLQETGNTVLSQGIVREGNERGSEKHGKPSRKRLEENRKLERSVQKREIIGMGSKRRD